MEISNGPHQAMEGHLSTSSMLQHHQHEKKPKYQKDQAPRCPRCDSTNTKFCYYNNYSLSQPRYFCKGCRRYWTQGGTLRNVPVGGSCRKNNKSSTSSSFSSSSIKKSLPQEPQDNFLIKNNTKTPSTSLSMTNLPLPPLSYDPSDLTLTFDPFLLRNHHPNTNHNPNPSFLDILRGPSQGGSGFQSLCYGFGGGGNDHGVTLPFHGGSDSTTATSATGMVEGSNDAGSNAVSLGLDSGRDYNWNGDGSLIYYGMG